MGGKGDGEGAAAIQVVARPWLAQGRGGGAKTVFGRNIVVKNSVMAMAW